MLCIRPLDPMLVSARWAEDPSDGAKSVLVVPEGCRSYSDDDDKIPHGSVGRLNARDAGNGIR